MSQIKYDRKAPEELKCIDTFFKIRYKNGLQCSHCGEKVHIGRRTDQPKLCNCNNCHNTFSMFKDTIFEKSSTSLRNWFAIIKFMNGAKKGISGYQLQRYIEDNGIPITYKTAYRCAMKVREAMGNSDFDYLMNGIIEVDETYVGGKPRKINKYPNPDKQEKYLKFIEEDNERRKKEGLKLHGGNGKRGFGADRFAVFGMYERNTRHVYTQVLFPDAKGHTTTGQQLLKIINKHTSEGAVIFSDDSSSYLILDVKNQEEIDKSTDAYVEPIYAKSNYKHLKHKTVCHSDKNYSSGGGLHTNSIESFWGIMKRSIVGSFHHISQKYAQCYFDEVCFKQNHRGEDMFDIILSQTIYPQPRWVGAPKKVYKNQGQTNYISKLAEKALSTQN